jgi:hypothetical protein
VIAHAKGTWNIMQQLGLTALERIVIGKRTRFHSIRRSLLLALGVPLLAGCAKPSYVSPVSVTRFTSEEQSQLGRGTISVEASASTQTDTLEYGLFAAEVADELGSLGYMVVESGADQLAVISLEQTVASPYRRNPVSVGGGASVGSYGSGVGLGVGIDLSGPDPDQISTQLFVAIRPANGGDNLWEGRASGVATSNSPLADPAANSDRMARALFFGFPGVSGETIQVE